MLILAKEILKKFIPVILFPYIPSLEERDK